jgi:Fe-S cluster biogenesis protein NfuA
MFLRLGEQGPEVGIVLQVLEDDMTMRQQVEETIEVIRPALQADGGDIILREVDESSGIVSVTLTGACTTCPASDQTLKAGIERIMKDRIDGVTEVVQVA